eukprot:100385-Chlamydomonas_euryale.AAC.5
MSGDCPTSGPAAHAAVPSEHDLCKAILDGHPYPCPCVPTINCTMLPMHGCSRPSAAETPTQIAAAGASIRPRARPRPSPAAADVFDSMHAQMDGEVSTTSHLTSPRAHAANYACSGRGGAFRLCAADGIGSLQCVSECRQVPCTTTMHKQHAVDSCELALRIHTAAINKLQDTNLVQVKGRWDDLSAEEKSQVTQLSLKDVAEGAFASWTRVQIRVPAQIRALACMQTSDDAVLLLLCA